MTGERLGFGLPMQPGVSVNPCVKGWNEIDRGGKEEIEVPCQYRCCTWLSTQCR